MSLILIKNPNKKLDNNSIVGNYYKNHRLAYLDDGKLIVKEFGENRNEAIERANEISDRLVFITISYDASPTIFELGGGEYIIGFNYATKTGNLPDLVSRIKSVNEKIPDFVSSEYGEWMIKRMIAKNYSICHINAKTKKLSVINKEGNWRKHHYGWSFDTIVSYTTGKEYNEWNGFGEY